MTYDADGLRSTKTVNGVKTEYQYVGDKLFYENRGNGDSFYYYYDSYGNISAIYHHRNGVKTAYHVVTNSQGDVIALYSWSGTKVAEYKYDAWGNCTIVSDTSSTGIATLNPIRYRGYYYDNDLGLYYLQSRYYDAEIGRFVNSDNVTDPGAGIIGYNTFIYCGNNPVNAADPSGHGKFWDWLCDKLDKLANLFTSEPAIEVAKVSDARNKTNNAPILSGLGKTKSVIDSVKFGAEIAYDAHTAAQDWNNHVDNIIGYGTQGDSYTPKPLSATYSFDTSYQEHCTTIYNEVDTYASIAYGSSISQMDGDQLAEFRHNLLTEDKTFAQQFYLFYGEEVGKIANEYYGG